MPSVTYNGPPPGPSYQGFKRTNGNSLSDLSIVSNSAGRVEIGNFGLTDEGDRTSAVLMGKGTSTNPVSIGTTGSKNFLGFWVESDQTSGDVRGLYMRLYLGGAAPGGGDAARIFATVKTGGVADSVNGAHISLSFQTTGYASGQGYATRNTLHIPDQASWGTGGTLAALGAEIWSDGTASDPANIDELSFIRCVNGGHSNGRANVDDDAFLLVYTGGANSSNNVIDTSNVETNYAYSARCKLNGTTAYMMFSSDAA